jgi:hypothetical protein
MWWELRWCAGFARYTPSRLRIAGKAGNAVSVRCDLHAQAHPIIAANFEAANTNHDGVLTKDKFLAAFKPVQ